jgi:hypothetical protein
VPQSPGLKYDVPSDRYLSSSEQLGENEHNWDSQNDVDFSSSDDVESFNRLNIINRSGRACKRWHDLKMKCSGQLPCQNCLEKFTKYI